MPISLTIARYDYTAAELREAATRSNDANAATRRMLALALVLEGYKRGEATLPSMVWFAGAGWIWPA
jgi:hypothetical protein